MSQNLENNPFTQLFPSVAAARNYASQHAQPIISENTEQPANVEIDGNIPKQYVNINDKIEKIFGITFNKNTRNQAVYLQDVKPNPNQTWINLEILDQALFERLLIDNPRKHLLNKQKIEVSQRVVESKAITYLYACYEDISSIQQQRGDDKQLLKMSQLILRNIATALKQPELYTNQDLCSQFYEIYTDGNYQYTGNLLDQLVEEIIRDEADIFAAVSEALTPILAHVHRQIALYSLGTFSVYSVFGILNSFSRNKHCAEVLITYATPNPMTTGKSFASTIFGDLLSLSCLPKTNGGQYNFFGKDQRLPNAEGPVWTLIESINSAMYTLIFQLLKISPTVKDKTLNWLMQCLKMNAERGQLWATQNSYDPFAELRVSTVADSFMLNLCSVLLRLCEPIISDQNGKKYLKIDATYGAWNGFESETCLIPYEGSDARPKSETYNFISQIFFLTHKAVDLGFRVCVEKLMRVNQELQRLMRVHQDAEASPGAAQEMIEAIQERLDADMTKFLSLRAALLEPKTLKLLSELHVATSKWIVQVILHDFPPPCSSYLLPDEIPLKFPLPETIPTTLTCIPEFLLENLNCFIPFIKRFNTDQFEYRNPGVLEHIVTMIVVVMRSNKRVKNPHLRAGLAETLESLLPDRNQPGGSYSSIEVFEKHPHCKEIIPSLLDVFVSIEMTGQSVQFDQKFNYRRPIYILMDYLWKIDVHKECFKRLAREAERNMEAVDPPIFLRFLNLLINDAVYLLDEALSNMAQLKTMQAARDSGEWAKLPAREREQNESMFTHTGMIAKFDNILGKWTINTLFFLTSEIQSTFEHPTMVDRIAAMLNYFLYHLVGPNMKNFKVKAQEQFEFRPADLVNSICTIYINLGNSDSFCLAVSQDGRSYNDKLFIQAEEVLYRIQASFLVPDLRIVAARVASQASQQRKKEELLADAPDEFLDPIMSTLMADPVILPSSRVTVDRPTIARHLLSDQTDPFNRAPLTMDMVKPDEELRNRIHTWMNERESANASAKD